MSKELHRRCTNLKRRVSPKYLPFFSHFHLHLHQYTFRLVGVLRFSKVLQVVTSFGPQMGYSSSTPCSLGSVFGNTGPGTIFLDTLLIRISITSSHGKCSGNDPNRHNVDISSLRGAMYWEMHPQGAGWRAWILHPSALASALGQSLGPRGMHFPIHPSSRQCTDTESFFNFAILYGKYFPPLYENIFSPMKENT